MNYPSQVKSKYPACDHIKRPVRDATATKEIIKSIEEDFRTLPTFEKGLFDYTTKKHYSLERNEFLKCRWNEYKKGLSERKFTPFQFVDVRDYHFHNSRTQYKPEESQYRKSDHRFTLRTGPGVDHIGQVPIPNELTMKRGFVSNNSNASKDKSNGDEANKEEKRESLDTHTSDNEAPKFYFHCTCTK
ncbi:unnamed protein product [Plutella xylostella]|uniref:(diamondback moth) hypothetical protein n=1 Tax=Plutella xylostella TaxID=51655 RepID=A0A8S4E0Q0_PLUXY|nr:unnamed protein product [Plutella xylostella]